MVRKPYLMQTERLTHKLLPTPCIDVLITMPSVMYLNRNGERIWQLIYSSIAQLTTIIT